MNTTRMNDRDRNRRNKRQQAEVATTAWEAFLSEMAEEGVYTPETQD